MVRVMKRIKESDTCWIVGAILVFAVIISSIWRLYYAVVDDLFYRNVIVGKYTGTIRPQGIMLKYPVTLIIALSSRLFQNVDIYGIFLILSHFVCFFLAARCVLRRFPAHRAAALCIASMVFWVVDVPNIIYFQFTTTATVYAAAGVLFLLTLEAKFKNFLLSIVMFVMSICIREQTFIMVLPFIVLAWMLQLWEEYKRGNIAKAVKQCVFYLCVLGVLYGGIAAVDYWAGDQDAVHEEFREHRANIRDYDGTPGYDDYPQFYQSLGENGLSRAEYNLIQRQMVVFDYSTDIHDIFKYMHGLNLENRARLEPKYKLAKAAAKFLTVWERVLVRPQIVIAGLTWIIIIVWLICKRKWAYLFFAVSGGLGIMGEAFVLLYRGRMPERVMQSLMLTVVLFLCGIFVRALSDDSDDKDGRDTRKNIICCVMMSAAYAAVFLLLLLPGIREKQTDYESRYARNTIINEYCAEHPENIYFTTGPIGDTDRMGSEYNNSFVNYISLMLNLGPSYYEMLETAGIEGTAEKAITTQENVYLIGKEGNADFVAIDEYFTEKYKGAYHCETVDTLEDSYCVWKVQVD